jgi:hypothetical protein
MHRREGKEPPAAKGPIYAAALLTIGGLLATTQAAPQMLSVGRLRDDTYGLQRAFDQFELWGGIRGTCQVLAYLAILYSLVPFLLQPKEPPC